MMLTFVIFVLLFLHPNNAIYTQFGMDIDCDEDNDCANQHIIAGIECNIDCSTPNSCRSSQLTFSHNCDYSNVNCSSYHACYDTEIFCPNDGYCELTSGFKSMKRATINCASNSLCILHCTDIESCSLVDLYCGYGSECFIECLENESCNELNIYAQNATVVETICNGEGCNNLNLYCPILNDSDTKCSFEFHGNGSQGIGIYAKNGLADVEIIGSNHSLQDIKIFCQDFYQSNCEISPITLRCSIRHSICNGYTYNIPTIPLIDNIVEGDNIDRPNYDNHQDDGYSGVFAQYYNMIRKDKLLTLIAIIPFISCILICLSGCCYANRDKFECIYNDYKRKKKNSIDSESNIAFEGQSFVNNKGDEYDDTESISELEFIMKNE